MPLCLSALWLKPHTVINYLSGRPPGLSFPASRCLSTGIPPSSVLLLSAERLAQCNIVKGNPFYGYGTLAVDGGDFVFDGAHVAVIKCK